MTILPRTSWGAASLLALLCVSRAEALDCECEYGAEYLHVGDGTGDAAGHMYEDVEWRSAWLEQTGGVASRPFYNLTLRGVDGAGGRRDLTVPLAPGWAYGRRTGMVPITPVVAAGCASKPRGSDSGPGCPECEVAGLVEGYFGASHPIETTLSNAGSPPDASWLVDSVLISESGDGIWLLEVHVRRDGEGSVVWFYTDSS